MSARSCVRGTPTVLGGAREEVVAALQCVLAN